MSNLTCRKHAASRTRNNMETH